MSERCARCDAELSAGANYCARCGAQASAPAATEPGDPMLGRTVLSRYRVVRQLGAGGMGRVYLAEQSMGQATRPVALKTLRSELVGDPKISGRFLRESEIVVRLGHPNTIQFHDFGQLDDGTLVIVMEYIEGRTLAEELRRGPLSLARVDALLRQICGSLAEAHAHGIVHRDIKPQNVLLTTRAGRTDFVKVLDFGIALHRGEQEHEDPTRLTTQGTLIGTPPYMSPEQFQDRDVDPRSDVYSLGVMLYEMITGSLPFDAKSAWQWAAAHLEQSPRPIGDHLHAKDLPEARALCVMRALEKDPASRPRDADELLREWLGTSEVAIEPAQAPPLSASDADVSLAPTLHAARPAPRRRAWLGWTALAGVVSAGIAISVWRGAAGSSTDFGAQTIAAHSDAKTHVPRASTKGKRRSALNRTVASKGERREGEQALAPETPRSATRVAADAEAPVHQPEAGPEAALDAVRQALDDANVIAAAQALRRARSVAPDHPELPALQARLSRLAGERATGLGKHNACAALPELGEHLREAGVTPPPALQQALQHCLSVENSPAVPIEN